jgi:hypothetical protein
VLVNPPPSPFTQDKWGRCIKCEALFYTGNATGGTCPKDGQSHANTGSPDYVIELHDHAEPIDQAISRHLLTEFGPCNDLLQAQATLEAACKAMIARGGGVIVVPRSVPTQFAEGPFLPRNAIQDVAAGSGVLIEDYRGGAMRLVVLPEGVVGSNRDVAGGMILERDLVNDVHGQGGGSALSIANRSRGGVNSIDDVLQRDVSPGIDARFYVTSLRGLCPGNWFSISNQATMTQGPIKALGLDGDNPYFVADTQFAYQKGTTYLHKNWFSALEISDTHNADDQSGTVSISRKTYGSGDTFGVSTNLAYSGDIMSGPGDEGGVVYAADVVHDVNLFWGEVETWDPETLELVYKSDAVNFSKLGTSRPIINMNPTTWITSGKVIVPATNHPYNGLWSPVVGNAEVQWDQSIIGKFITIDEPSEYWDPDPQGADAQIPDRSESLSLLGHHIVRRWFRIGTLTTRPNDQWWSLEVEGVGFGGNSQTVQPTLLNDNNLFWGGPKELRYIIAPGSWVIDVRNALESGRQQPGTSQERTIRLAPFHNSASAFAQNDPITQPAGPTPWIPTSYRSRNTHFFPNLIDGSSCFVAGNAGPTRMDAGLFIDDGHPGRTLPQIRERQKDGQMPFRAGVNITSGTEYGINIVGPVLQSALAIGGPVGDSAILISGTVVNSAISLSQADGNKKAIEWAGQNGSKIYCNPTSGDFVIEATGSVNLSTKGTIQQSGLSGTSVPAKNLRGIGVFVTGDTLTMPIGFAAQELDASYSILVQCDWQTTAIVQNKTISGFAVTFGTAAPHSGGGHLDWLLVR